MCNAAPVESIGGRCKFNLDDVARFRTVDWMHTTDGKGQRFRPRWKVSGWEGKLMEAQPAIAATTRAAMIRMRLPMGAF